MLISATRLGRVQRVQPRLPAVPVMLGRGQAEILHGLLQAPARARPAGRTLAGSARQQAEQRALAAADDSAVWLT